MKLKKQLSRMIAAAMCATMVASAIPANLSINVMAASSSSVTESTTATTENPRMDYIENGDFETTTGILTYLTGFSSWTEVKDTSGEDRVGTSENARGTYSLRLVGREDVVYQMVEVVPGVTYELTGYVKLASAGENSSAGDGVFGIRGYSRNQVSDTYMTFDTGVLEFGKYKASGIKLENDTLIRGDWMKFTYTVEAPQNTPYLYVYLGGLTRSVYYDDISLHAVFSDVAEKDSEGFYEVTPLSKYEISGNADLGISSDDVFPFWTESFGRPTLAGLKDDYKYEGKYGLYLNNGANSISQMVEVEPSETYELTGYVYLNRTGLKLNYYGYQDADKTTATETKKTMEINVAGTASSTGLIFTDPETESSVSGPTVGKWYKFSYKVTTDANTKFLDLVLMGNGSGYYDNISLCEVETESATPDINLVLNGNFEGACAEIKWEGYNAAGEATTNGKINPILSESGYFSGMINVDENTNRLKLSFTDSTGTSVFTDVAVRRVIEPDRLGLSLNSNSYYTTETTAIATLMPNTTAYEITDDWKVNWQVLHGEEVICEGKDLVLSQTEDDGDWMDGEVEISFPLESCYEEGNVFKATLYVSGVEKEIEEWEFDYCYEKPTTLNEEGIFVEEDGDMFHPVFAYHMITTKTTEAVLDDCIDRLGINLFQLAKGFRAEGNWATARKYLDYLESKGAKALVCLYADTIGSAPEIYDATVAYIQEICDHDAIYAWIVEDEPHATDEDLLRAAYDMVRELDPKDRPVYTVDQREAYYPKLIRNADMVAIDNYPYGRWNAMTYIYDSAKYAVEAAAISNKPVYTLLQCFENLSGSYINPNLATGTLYMPSANAIRNMIYQSLMAGTKGFGYYGLDYGPGTDNDGYNYDTSGYVITEPSVRTASDLANGIAEYAKKEQQMMFEYFVEHRYPTFNANIDDDENIRYVSFLRDNKIYMVLLNKKEFETQTVSVPLTGKDVNGETVTIAGFTAEAYAGNGVLNADGTTEFMTDSIESGGSTLNVTLQPGAAVVYMITPKSEFDWGIGVTDITLNQTELSMYVGNQETLQATVTPSDATFQELSWESSNPAVATVSQNGRVTAVGKGEATITATSSFHVGITASCTVKVSVPSVDTGLIKNGGFENFVDLDFDDWTEVGSSSSVLTPVSSPNPVYDGKAALKINGSARKISQKVDVEPGKAYVFTGYVNLIEGKEALKLQYNGYAADGTTSTISSSMTIFGGTQGESSGTLEIIDLETGYPETILTAGKWYKFSRTVTTSASTEYLDIIIQGSGSGYVDNISLFEVLPPEVSIDGVECRTLEEAIATAPAGAKLVLLEHVDMGTEDITLSNAVTLDLNGKTLTAGYVTAFEGNNIVDSSDGKTGLLKVAKGNLILPESNAQMPVYKGTDGYVFADITPQEKRNSYIGANIFELIFRPSFGTGAVVNNTLLAGGGETADIIIGIHLEWIENGETKFQDLEYGKDEDGNCLVGKAYSEGMAFYIKASGTSNFQNLSFTPYVKSGTGVICYGTNYASNVHKDYNIGVWEGTINPDWE